MNTLKSLQKHKPKKSGKDSLLSVDIAGTIREEDIGKRTFIRGLNEKVEQTKNDSKQKEEYEFMKSMTIHSVLSAPLGIEVCVWRNGICGLESVGY